MKQLESGTDRSSILLGSTISLLEGCCANQ